MGSRQPAHTSTVTGTSGSVVDDVIAAVDIAISSEPPNNKLLIY